MGSSASAIHDHLDTYEAMCKAIGVKEQSDSFKHMDQILKAYNVKDTYEFFRVVEKKNDEIFTNGVKAHDLKYLVKDNWVQFDSFRQGMFCYKLTSKNGKEPEYTFPVPLEDIGTATMLKEDKALTFMRWIRKAINDKTLIEVK